MEYKDIEVFLGIVRTRSITKTAENMFLSQSTISTRLKHLENELDCELIKRAKGQRRIQLTKYGKEFIPIAERWEKLFQETSLLKEKNNQVLRIATNESTYYELIAPFTTKLLRESPDLKLSVKICDSLAIYDLLENNLIDYGFASFESFRDKIISKCINSQKICILTYGEKFEKNKSIHPNDLDITEEIRFTGGHFDNIDGWYNKWFKNPYAFLIDVNSPHAAIYYLKEFGGWSICPLGLAKTLSYDTDLQIYNLEEAPIDRKIYLLQREDNNMRHLDMGKNFERKLEIYLQENLMQID